MLAAVIKLNKRIYDCEGAKDLLVLEVFAVESSTAYVEGGLDY